MNWIHDDGKGSLLPGYFSIVVFGSVFKKLRHVNKNTN